MEAMAIKHGELVTLEELNPSSPFFKEGASVRVTGRKWYLYLKEGFDFGLVQWGCVERGFGDEGLMVKSCTSKGVLCLLRRLQEYTVETAIAVVADGNATLKIDTQHLRDISFRIGSIYQLIGELLIQPDNEAILQARVGRIVDGIDLSLYHQSLQLLRQFQADHLNNSTS
ncbi:hypothetical protein SADUNF_Sadunf05G0011600 [Salix dunnii]|uniref:CST complex subunit TEN1 n=1 Tax=Salix dunnii TaxID=1413687 RepID=A0A835K371_9ROSI|nr:hypothetical protein SADUNF_Sadunf05G0011600 [Salix dunnii]